ncbi:hypothetical protein BDW74DRAFT_173431 [Aspergillus multicolor]|uniref:uncharacterized protein n=1 Tax=Aspergillus multicolor TaxID=41759 RepID=UPI003CCD10D3
MAKLSIRSSKSSLRGEKAAETNDQPDLAREPSTTSAPADAPTQAEAEAKVEAEAQPRTKEQAQKTEPETSSSSSESESGDGKDKDTCKDERKRKRFTRGLKKFGKTAYKVAKPLLYVLGAVGACALGAVAVPFVIVDTVLGGVLMLVVRTLFSIVYLPIKLIVCCFLDD